MIVASEILSPGWGSLNHDYCGQQSEHLFDRDLDDVDHGNHLLSDNACLRFVLDPEKRRGDSTEVRERDRMIKVEERIKSRTESPQVGSSDEDRKHPRVCADCQTSKTPLWRGGPAGPKSLCNACGIRYRKRRRRGIALIETGREMLLDSNNRQEKILLLLQREFVGEEDTEAAILLMAMSCGLFVSS